VGLVLGCGVVGVVCGFFFLGAFSFFMQMRHFLPVWVLWLDKWVGGVV
jgi:hypothetical protein